MQDRLKRALLPVSKVWSYVSYTWCDNHGIYAHNSLFGSIHIVRCPRGSLIRRSTVKTGTNPNRNPDPNRPTTQAIFVSLVLLALIVRVVFEVAEPSGNWADTVRSVLPVLAYINAAVNNVNEYNYHLEVTVPQPRYVTQWMSVWLIATCTLWHNVITTDAMVPVPYGRCRPILVAWPTFVSYLSTQCLEWVNVPWCMTMHIVVQMIAIRFIVLNETTLGKVKFRPSRRAETKVLDKSLVSV